MDLSSNISGSNSILKKLFGYSELKEPSNKLIRDDIPNSIYRHGYSSVPKNRKTIIDFVVFQGLSAMTAKGS
ncbi:MAG: hypothetical protein JXB24_09570 [Bacteroidales bacterium]|nr:hypothetical protein [Bacteroidales bacterium]